MLDGNSVTRQRALQGVARSLASTHQDAEYCLARRRPSERPRDSHRENQGQVVVNDEGPVLNITNERTPQTQMFSHVFTAAQCGTVDEHHVC